MCDRLGIRDVIVAISVLSSLILSASDALGWLVEDFGVTDNRLSYFGSQRVPWTPFLIRSVSFGKEG
jgi:hypothetical protein